MNTVTEIVRDRVAPFEQGPSTDDIINKRVVLHSIRYQDGEKGEIMYAEVSETEDGPKGEVYIRGSKTKEKLHLIEKENAFPCHGTFIKLGRAYDLV